MPGEIFVLIAMAIVASTVVSILKMVLDYRGGHRPEAAGPGSLTASELKAMIQQAVAEANAPLVERVEALEEHPRQLEAATPLIDLDEPADVLIEEPTATRRRVR